MTSHVTYTNTNNAREEKTLCLVGGARLSPGGLHLGHLVGSFLPLLDFADPTEYFFVIKDTEPLVRHDPAVRQQLLIDTVADSLSVPFSDRIMVTTASDILLNSYYLYSHILDVVSYNSLVTAHFRKQQLREQQSQESIKNFLFPIDEAAVLLGLRADYFLSNDDNIRLVRFARDIVRKSKRRGVEAISNLPELRHHSKLSRLLGPGYDRMCKANKNTIRTTEPVAELRQKVHTLTSWKQYFERNADALADFKDSPSRFVFGENYLPFVYLNLFGPEQIDDDKKRYFSDISKRVELEELLFKILNELIDPMRQRKLNLITNKTMIYDRLESDLGKTIKRVRETDSRIVKLIGLP